MGTNADTEKLKELYQSLDRLKASGEDVIAEIRREINNIELQYLKDDLFPEIMKIIGERISWLRCTIDMSLQFDGDKQLDYSFCKSGSIVFVRDKYECNGHDENAIEKSGTGIFANIVNRLCAENGKQPPEYNPKKLRGV